LAEGRASGPVLASFAHPDDAEISAGGTLAKWAESGREVHLVVLTNGDRGSSDPERDPDDIAQIRAQETAQAASVIGLAGVRILETRDGELENTWGVRAAIVRAIREIRPAIVLTCDPTAWFFESRYINHSDHRAAGAATVDAAFPAAGNPHFYAEQLAEGLSVWNAAQVWLGWTLEPNHHEDISDHMDRKIAALAEHRSQVEGDMLGYFEEWLPREAGDAGRRIGVRYAESFRVMDLE
jgi:LmbE family N-acetylglucosaminyl deacetylase